MPRNRDTTPPTSAIDAELEALDEKDQSLLTKLDRFAVLQAQYEAQRKEIESKRRQLELEKEKRRAEEEEEEAEAARREAERVEREKRERERERRERELKEEREREEAERRRKEEEKKEAGRRLSTRSVTRTPGRPSNTHQEPEAWDMMSDNDICTRCKERGDDCYRPAKGPTNTPRSSSAPTKPGSGHIGLEKGMRCRGCRDSRKKCSTDTIEPAAPTSASRAGTPGDQNERKRKSATEDVEPARAKKAKTNLQMHENREELNEGVRTSSDKAMGELEVLFTDLVKHQEITLSIQKDILRVISSARGDCDSRPEPKREEEAAEVFLGFNAGEELEYAEEADELLLGSDMGYELE